MSDNFSESLKLVLQCEGGNDDDPHDPGGRTSRGITQREYDEYCALNQYDKRDVWQASDTEIKNIYENSYWLPYCPALPRGVDYLFFDMSVLQGIHEAAVLLQRGLGVTDDGHLGIVTRAALQRFPVASLIQEISEERRTFFENLRTFRWFGKGWLARVNSVEQNALKMAEQGDDHASIA